MNATKLARRAVAVVPKLQIRPKYPKALEEIGEGVAEVLIVAKPVFTGAVTLAPDALGAPVELLLMAALITSNQFAPMSEVPRLFAKAWMLKSSLFVTFFGSSGSAYWKPMGYVSLEKALKRGEK